MAKKLIYTKPERLALRNHPEFTERWVQDRIAEDPSILGLGDVVLIDRERVQPRAGRLDLLLLQPDDNRRYEVELMLGSTDESHIIRTIEYWDTERNRYPGYDHVAVLVAEDITSRFLNVLSLFSGSIPFIGIQLNALQVADHVVLDFVRVLDLTTLRLDDESEALVETDRRYWEGKTTPAVIGAVDEVLEWVNGQLEEPMQLNYNKYYIGLTDGSRSRNFVFFRPRKKFVHLRVQVGDRERWAEKADEAGLDASLTKRGMQVTIAPRALKEQRELLMELVGAAVERYQGG